jgi:hypothetical protein
MTSSLQIKKQLNRSEFDQFRMSRRQSLLRKSSYFERTLVDWVELVSIKLKDFYRFEIIPQSSRFIKGYGLVYMDIFLRVICRPEKFGVDHGMKFCVELDEPYHDSERQKTLDRGREAAIQKKHPSIRIVRIKLADMENQAKVIDTLTTAFDWWSLK